MKKFTKHTLVAMSVFILSFILFSCGNAETEFDFEKEDPVHDSSDQKNDTNEDVIYNSDTAETEGLDNHNSEDVITEDNNDVLSVSSISVPIVSEDEQDNVDTYNVPLSLKKKYIEMVGKKVSDLDKTYENWEYWDNYDGASMFFSDKLDCAILVSTEDVEFMTAPVHITTPDAVCVALMVNMNMLYDVPDRISVNDFEQCTGLCVNSYFGKDTPEYDCLYTEIEDAGIHLTIYSGGPDVITAQDAVLISIPDEYGE